MRRYCQMCHSGLYSQLCTKPVPAAVVGMYTACLQMLIPEVPCFLGLGVIDLPEALCGLRCELSCMQAGAFKQYCTHTRTCKLLPDRC